MIGADEAKQMANAFRDQRTLAAALIERVDEAIQGAVSRDDLTHHFTVGVRDFPAEIVKDVASRYRCLGWAVALSDATTEPGWSMRVQT